MTGSNGVSRRELLAGIGTAGAAIGASAVGASTASALLSDTEQFAGNVFTAGEVDIGVTYDAYYHSTSDGTTDTDTGTVDGDPKGGLDVESISPGDSGRFVLTPEVRGNPVYLWLCGGLTRNAENGKTEAETDEIAFQGKKPVDRKGKKGEVGDALQARLSYVSSREDPSDRVVLREGNFRQVFEMLGYGVPLSAAPNYDATGYRTFDGPGEQGCFEADGSDQPSVELEWWMPTSTNNNVMSDQLEFELVFHAQQCRHNDGRQNPCAARKGISFVSFCVDEGESVSDADVSFSVTERKAEGEPVALEWHSDVPLRTVVLKYGTVFENFYVDDATSGTVTVGAGDVRLVYEPKDSPALSNGQEPSDPCPDGETGIKYEYEGGEFSRDS